MSIAQQLLVPHWSSGGAAGALPYSVNFATQPDGALPAGWTGVTWAISGGAAINTPTQGSELLVNGTFAAWTGDNPDGWSVVGEDANNYVTEATGACRMVSNNTAAIRIQQTVLTVSAWTRLAIDVTAAVSGAIRYQDQSNGITMDLTAPGTFSKTGLPAHSILRIIRNGACDLTFDNSSAKVITGLISYRDAEAADVIIKAGWAVGSNHWAGIVAKSDGTLNNCIVAYHNQANAYLHKRVGGVLTALTNGAITYAAGSDVEIRTSGNTVQLFYNNTQVGADQTVSDAAIVNNTQHGLFSTSQGNTCTEFSMVAN